MNKSMKITYPVELQDPYTEDYFEVEVDLTFSELVPAYISGPPEDCYPAEGGELQDMSIPSLGMGYNASEDYLKAHMSENAFETMLENALIDAEEKYLDRKYASVEDYAGRDYEYDWD
jgi:hypothetical protein